MPLTEERVREIADGGAWFQLYRSESAQLATDWLALRQQVREAEGRMQELSAKRDEWRDSAERSMDNIAALRQQNAALRAMVEEAADTLDFAAPRWSRKNPETGAVEDLADSLRARLAALGEP